MSFKLRDDLEERGGLTHPQYIVLREMVFLSMDHHSIAVSPTTLAYKLRCGERTVQRSIQSMVQLGVLVPCGSAGGRGNIQAYEIHLEVLPVREKKKPIRRTRKIQDAPPAPEPGEYYNVEYAIEEYHRWERMIAESDPRNPKLIYWKDALIESRADLAKHGIIMEGVAI